MSPNAQQLLQANTSCEVRFDTLTCQLYATDASLYQIIPVGVAFPRNASEASSAIRAAAEAGIAVTPRGAGTGLAGGALGRGLIIDFYRHNQQITEFDRDGRTVRVGAGVVLDQLNAFLRPHGLQFGPDVATSSRASIGGMIANNSSGAHVPVYGTTADHLEEVETILPSGEVCRIQASHRLTSLQGIQQTADRLVADHAAIIRERFPALPKRWPGYQFDRYLRRSGDLTQLIAGSEGTLAAITSAKLKLLPLPKRRSLGVLFFASVADAMQATVELLDLNAAAIEHVDRLLFDQTRGQMLFRATRDLLRLDEEPCESMLLVEFFDDAEDKLAALGQRKLGLRQLLFREEREQAMVWSMRKAGLTLLTSRKGPAKPVTGIEDVAIRPNQLPAFVSELERILHRHRLEASFYGHAAGGLLHVRPVIDIHIHDGIRTFRQITDEVSLLTAEFRGSIAGEHGVGIARTEYLAAHLGHELMEASRTLKEAFDPTYLMNPGKIVPVPPSSGVDPDYRIDTNLRVESGDIVLPGLPVLGFVERDESFVENLEQCNGSGVCLKQTATMCPTYVVTRDELMSTRGRANTIRAALDGRLGPREEALLSPELDAALQPCLSCKACKTECPSNVDLAQLKAELLFARRRRTGPSLLDRMVASSDLLGRLGTAMPVLANAVLRSRPMRRLMQQVLGLDAARIPPLYADRRFDHWFRSHHRESQTVAPQVVLWDDTWVRYHEPQIGIAAVRVLEAIGFQVVLADGRSCCGRPAFSRGLLDEAAAMGRHNIALLEDRYPGLPVLFLEPSCQSMFIDDYLQLRLPGAEAVARRCLSFESFVHEALSSRSFQFQPLKEAGLPVSPARLAIHAHCHAKALTDVSVFQRLAQRIPGLEAKMLDTACCGMAGAYGMLEHNHDLSRQVAAPMIDKIRALPAGTRLVASGTSCRHQIHDLAGVQALHMAEVLALAV